MKEGEGGKEMKTMSIKGETGSGKRMTGIREMKDKGEKGGGLSAHGSLIHMTFKQPLFQSHSSSILHKFSSSFF